MRRMRWEGDVDQSLSLSTPVDQTCQYDNDLCQEEEYDFFVSLKIA